MDKCHMTSQMELWEGRDKACDPGGCSFLSFHFGCTASEADCL